MARPKEVSNMTINKIIELSVHSTKSRREIADELGVSPNTVWRYRKKYLGSIVY